MGLESLGLALTSSNVNPGNATSLQKNAKGIYTLNLPDDAFFPGGQASTQLNLEETMERAIGRSKPPSRRPYPVPFRVNFGENALDPAISAILWPGKKEL